MVVNFQPPASQSSYFSWFPRCNEASFPFNKLPDVLKKRFFELLTPAQAWQLGQVSKSFQAQKNSVRKGSPRIVDYLILNGRATDADDFQEDFGWKLFKGLTITHDGYSVVALDNVDTFNNIEGVHVIRGLSIKNLSQEKVESLLNHCIQYSTIPRFQLLCGDHAYRQDFFQTLKEDLKFTVFVGKMKFRNAPDIPLNFLKQFVVGLEAFNFCVKLRLTDDEETEMDNYLDEVATCPKDRVGYIHVHLDIPNVNVNTNNNNNNGKHMYFYKNYSLCNSFYDDFAEKAAIIFGYTRTGPPKFFM